MKKQLLVILLSLSGLSQAASMVAKGPNLEVRIFDNKPCILVPEDKEAKGAEVTWQGELLQACWKAIPGGIAIIDETGDQGVVPAEAFKKDLEV